jgi:hypothetical protein
MKTILCFTEDYEKRKVILRHDKDVRIFKEVRKAHLELTDGKGNPIENIEYIVIRFPKTKKIDLGSLKMNSHDRWVTGFQMNDLGDEMELLFYNRITFVNKIYALRNAGLFKVTQRRIPDKEKGEIFYFYINAKGIKEYAYNAFGLLIEFLVQSLKKKKEREEVNG